MNKNLYFILLATLLFSLTITAQNYTSSENDEIVNRYDYTSYHWNKTNLNYYIYNTSSHMTALECKNAISIALNNWSTYTSFTFQETTDPSNADIVFMWATGVHGTCEAFGPDSFTRAHTLPDHSGSIMTKANVHFNDYKNWVFNANPVGNEIDLVHTAMHEVGHALGLNESDVSNAIMYQGNNSGRKLKPDDLQGIWSIYGCPFTIQGPSTVCTDANYLLSLPSGFYVSYSVSGALIEETHIGSYGYLVSKNADGVGNIYATLRDWSTMDYIWTISKENIAVGTPDLGMSIQFKTATGVNGCWASNMIGNTFTIESDLSWAYDRVEAQLYRMDNNFNPSTLVNSWSNISTTNASIPGYTAGWYLFKLRGVNDCGYSDWLEQEVEMVDFSMLNFLLDYDAASETLTLTLIEPDAENSTQQVLRGMYDVELWNGLTTTKVRSYRTDLTKYQMSLAGLPRGIYIVRVVIDGKIYSKKFVKR